MKGGSGECRGEAIVPPSKTLTFPMLILLSPSKTLDFDTPSPVPESTRPALHSDAQQLAARLREFPLPQLVKLMDVSDKLATQVFENLQAWESQPTSKRAKQALFAYQGDVYAGLDAGSFSKSDIEHAQTHLRILSGLYGVLRPLDLIQPYRLEMATSLETRRGMDLYAFWGDRITEQLQRDLTEQKDNLVVNLASSEYFRVVNARELGARVVTPSFKDRKDGKYRFLTLFGKKARGQMARYIIQRRLKKADSLKKSYHVDGYHYNQDLSSGDEWVFTRETS